MSKSNPFKPAKFNFKKIKGKYLLTNDFGEWMYASEKDFADFKNGKLSAESHVFAELEKKFFIRNKKNYPELIDKYLRFNKSFLQGPSLHIIVLTLRCNHRCLYCQVSPVAKDVSGTDMTEMTAKKVVDTIFKSPSNNIRIEFQGGEPLLNWKVLKYIVKYAKGLNETKKKNLLISLVSNLTLMDGEKLKFLLEEDVEISTSFDGPADVHNKNRIFAEGDSHELVTAQIKKIQKSMAEKRKKEKGKTIFPIHGILTTTRFSLNKYKEIIDEYKRLGLDGIFLRPLSPLGLERQTAGIIGYGAEEFIRFYKRSMDYILELNLKGQFFKEINTFYLLRKILKKKDPNYLEMRSPCGAGIGQMAYDYNGIVYTCDEGRMAERMGHSNFRLGNVFENDYDRMLNNETVKIMGLASCLDNQAGCLDCVYKPYCGICPLTNYIEYGTIFPQITNTDKCKINKAILDYLFAKINDKRVRPILESWL